MLDPGRYLLGVVEIFLLVGFAWLGAVGLRRRALSDVDGAPAHLATMVIALAILLLTGELLGAFGWFQAAPYIAAVIVIGSGIRLGLERGWGCPSGAAASCFSPQPRGRPAADSPGEKPSKTEGHSRPPSPTELIALLIAAVAV